MSLWFHRCQVIREILVLQVYFGQNVVWNWNESSAKGDGKVLKLGDPVYVIKKVSSPAEAAA